MALNEGHICIIKHSIKYYKKMAKAFPDEEIWKIAIKDCERLLAEEEA